MGRDHETKVLFSEVVEVVLCPHSSLSFFRDQAWKPDQEQKKPATVAVPYG